ncbi:MAG: tRNA threonylcarbamoyladenosine dehydratase [Planctomycetota bacterium]|jgi:tRNA A37 threonylcarbamoyladenosine dehydratase|nr:tRNA threonylcarbamoyladenosine dehydratase [Planctomycetota bacterium]
MDWMERTRLLLGDNGVRRINRAKIVVFGLGAVGSYAVEAPARAGVGAFRLVDFDEIRPSNLNRQIYALHSTIGRKKVDVAKERILDIHPRAAVEAEPVFAHADTLGRLLSGDPDLVIDAVDSLNPKTEIIAASAALGLPIFSAMGAATRLDASRVKFGPLFEASGCPLNRHLKKRLRRHGVEGDLWCVYSDEAKHPEAVAAAGADAGLEPGDEYERGRKRDTLGSLSSLTGIFGLRLAHEAILRLAGFHTGRGTDARPPWSTGLRLGDTTEL